MRVSNPAEACAAEAMPPAIVVFAGATNLRCLRLLRPRFRHCFVAVWQGGQWIVCDPLAHRTDLLVIGERTARQLVDWYRSHGLTVLETRVRAAPRRMAPIRPFTCVEAVKRVLGIHAPWIITPWQLHKFIVKEKNLDNWNISLYESDSARRGPQGS